jgi:hypothetical protein
MCSNEGEKHDADGLGLSEVLAFARPLVGAYVGLTGCPKRGARYRARRLCEPWRLVRPRGPNLQFEEVGKGMTKTVTLTEPELAGEWDVEPLEDGRLLLTRHVGPSVDELAERAGGERLSPEEFQRRWGDLPRDGEG